MGHQSLTYHKPGAFLKLRLRCSCSIINSLDLDHFHLGSAVLLKIDLCYGIKYSFSLTVAGTVVLLHILNPGTLPDKKTVYPVMLRILIAAVVYSAAGYYNDIRIFTYVKIIIYGFTQSALCHHDRDMDAFIPGARLNLYRKSLPVLTRYYLYILGRGSSCGHSVSTYIICSLRNLMEIRNLS